MYIYIIFLFIFLAARLLNFDARMGIAFHSGGVATMPLIASTVRTNTIANLPLKKEIKLPQRNLPPNLSRAMRFVKCNDVKLRSHHLLHFRSKIDN